MQNVLTSGKNLIPGIKHRRIFNIHEFDLSNNLPALFSDLSEKDEINAQGFSGLQDHLRIIILYQSQPMKGFLHFPPRHEID